MRTIVLELELLKDLCVPWVHASQLFQSCQRQINQKPLWALVVDLPWVLDVAKVWIVVSASKIISRKDKSSLKAFHDVRTLLLGFKPSDLARFIVGFEVFSIYSDLPSFSWIRVSSKTWNCLFTSWKACTFFIMQTNMQTQCVASYHYSNDKPNTKRTQNTHNNLSTFRARTVAQREDC